MTSNSVVDLERECNLRTVVPGNFSKEADREFLKKYAKHGVGDLIAMTEKTQTICDVALHMITNYFNDSEEATAFFIERVVQTEDCRNYYPIGDDLEPGKLEEVYNDLSLMQTPRAEEFFFGIFTKGEYEGKEYEGRKELAVRFLLINLYRKLGAKLFENERALSLLGSMNDSSCNRKVRRGILTAIFNIQEEGIADIINKAIIEMADRKNKDAALREYACAAMASRKGVDITQALREKVICWGTEGMPQVMNAARESLLSQRDPLAIKYFHEIFRGEIGGGELRSFLEGMRDYDSDEFVRFLIKVVRRENGYYGTLEEAEIALRELGMKRSLKEERKEVLLSILCTDPDYDFRKIAYNMLVPGIIEEKEFKQLISEA